MPSVQLEKLRPQINAIITQYEQSDMFVHSLMSLLRSYSVHINGSPLNVSAFSTISRLNVPEVVLNHLEISLKHLAQENPSQTKPIISNLWNQPFFEPKKIAITLLSNLDPQHKEVFFDNIKKWVDSDTEEPIIEEIFENVKKNQEILNSDQWLSVVEKWLNSKETRIQKIGLEAVADIIETGVIKNLPGVFRLVEPLLSKPHIAINRDLVKLIESCIVSSQQETAAFLIHLSIMYPKPEVFALIRKCASSFDPDYASEIIKNLEK